MKFTLILYLVLNGNVTISKITQADEFTCSLNAITFMSTRADGDKWKPLHAECKPKPAPKPKKAKPVDGVQLQSLT
jgi:hypothetical protein